MQGARKELVKKSGEDEGSNCSSGGHTVTLLSQMKTICTQAAIQPTETWMWELTNKKQSSCSVVAVHMPMSQNHKGSLEPNWNNI